MIFHLAEKVTWEACLKQDFYVCKSFSQEGFIHCSTLQQLTATANRYYSNRNDLVLLCLDENALQSPLLYEKAASTGELFPHIYGNINKTAIRKLLVILPDETGTFDLDNVLGSAGIF
jgi:uncharacterized protein (DUF952 family)